MVTVVDEPAPRLCVLLVKREGRHRRGAWQLPGTFLHPGETLSVAALRALRVKAGVEGVHPSQLHVLDDPGRDDPRWVLSVAHTDVVPAARLRERLPAAALVPVREGVDLAFDHDAIVALAVADLHARYASVPDPAALLHEPFTLRQLQVLHEAVVETRLAKDSFRRAREPLLQPTGELSEGQVGKPARLWRRAM